MIYITDQELKIVLEALDFIAAAYLAEDKYDDLSDELVRRQQEAEEKDI